MLATQIETLRSSTNAAELAELINAEAPVGMRIQIRADLTDPPSPAVARIGDLEATGVDADDAVVQLARVLATHLADLAAVMSQEPAELEQGPR